MPIRYRRSQRSASPADLSDTTGIFLLGIALTITILYHGVLLFNRQFIHTYDALIHIFFGAHYAQTWFDPWEPRWYTGFLTVAYPPLSHYLIALTSKVMGFLNGFALVQLFALLNLTVGVFRFSSLLVGPRAAGYASLSLALSSALSETVHVFGQLPTTLSLGFLLNAIPFAWRYIQYGNKVNLMKAIVWTAATTAGHHVTTLFGSVFFTGPLIVVLVLQAFRMPRPGEPSGDSILQKLKRRVYRLLPRLYRTGIFGLLAVSMLVLVVFPYWYWSGKDPILQVPIPHGSRANFLERRDLGLMFWVIPWASSIWFLPYSIYKGLNWRWPVLASLLLLAFLGTGGTTPGPRLLLRGAFDILTLDRFTFWAAMLILPFMGMALESLVHGRLKLYINANFGNWVRWTFLGLFLVSICGAAISISTLTRYRKMQPDPINIQPIINFIEKDEHWRYRYLNLGFGDQMAWLSANTRAATPDGNYHSARRLPELTTTPVERLEGAKYTGVPGIGSLEQFLTTPEKYNLKYVFSNDAFYDPTLYFHGWHRLGRLENGIEVWEREDIPPLPERLPRKTWPIYQRLMWGILPLLAFVLAWLALFIPEGVVRLQFWQKSGLGHWLYTMLKEDALLQQPIGVWHPWHKIRKPLEQVLNFTRCSVLFRGVSSAFLFLIVVAPIVLGVLHARVETGSPEQAVIQYWDHLDFKRFGPAYEWLEPLEGLDYERWLLDMSVVGGLRTGYAKLDSIVPHLVSYDGNPQNPETGDKALVEVDLIWFTSLNEIHDTIKHELIRTKKGWRIEARPLVKVRSQQRFAVQPDLAYYRAPRRLTTLATASTELMDRPKLEVLESRLVSYQTEVTDFNTNTEHFVTQYAIVGRIKNSDSRPADTTLSGVLRDKDGTALSYNNAAFVVIHKLLPDETTPFRIDFSAVSAPPDPEKIADYEVFVKAVVTTHDLERDLASWSQVDGDKLEIRAVNLGTQEATIPHALISLYDQDGLAWVNESYGMEAVPPLEFKTLEADLSLPPEYKIRHQRRNPLAGDPLQYSFALNHKVLRAYLVQLHAFYRGS